MLGDRVQHPLRGPLAPQHERRAERHTEREVGEAPGVEERRGDVRVLAGAQRDLREERRSRGQRLGLLA